MPRNTYLVCYDICDDKRGTPATKRWSITTPPPEDRPLESSQPSTSDVRRLVPARDDLRPLYVTGHGLSIGKTGEVLQIRDGKKLAQEARVSEISQVNVFGNVSITAAALQGLCWSEKPIAHFSPGAAGGPRHRDGRAAGDRG